MNEKITLQDLVDALAQKHSMPKKDAEAFVKAMFDLVEEGLERDKYVKVKGLGSFKLIGVEGRESVNVNTGERFRIEGHSKVSFTPDTGLRDLINRPFAHFETVVVNDGVDLNTPMEEEGDNDMDDATESIVEQKVEAVSEAVSAPEPAVVESEGTVADSEPEPVAEEQKVVEEPKIIEEPKVVEEPKVADEPNAKAEAVVADSEPERKPEPESKIVEPVAEANVQKVEEPQVVKAVAEESMKPIEQSVSEQPTSTQVEGSAQQAQQEEERKSHKAAYVIGLVAVLLIGVIIWFVMGMKSKEKEMKQPNQSPVTQTVEEEKNVEPVSADTTASTGEPRPSVAEQPMTSPDQAPAMSEASGTQQTAVAQPQQLDPDKQYKAVGTLTVHKLGVGESLAKLSRKYYGTNKLQNYIYEYNKADLKNPDVIPVGAMIKVPKLIPVE